MANPDNPSPKTGSTEVNSQIKNAAANLVGPAAQLAQGASVFKVASDTLKDSALNKLLGPTALFAGSLIGVLKTINSIVKQSGILERGLKRIANLQQIQGKFETLLKSAEAATKRIKDLYKFTAQSPFDFSDVAEGNRLLEALSKGALSGSRGMKLVGDSAAATGQSFSETSERVGKLYAALRSGRSLDKIMFQLQMTGMVTDELANKLETLESTGASFETMWGAVEQSLRSTEGGMKSEMKSLDALTTQLNNASAAMEQAFAAPFIDAQAKAIENTIKATQNLTPVLAEIGQDLAPILQFFQNLKNELVVNTLATDGFADALKYAWRAGSVLFASLTVGTLARFAAGLGQTVTEVTAFTGSLSSAWKASIATADAAAGLANATQLAADASKAMAAGNIFSAASLKAQALWAGISTRAIALHVAALRVATATTGAFSLTTYLTSLAGGGVAAGLRLVGTALNFITAGLARAAAAALANPVFLIVGTATAAAAAIYKWAEGVKEVEKSYYALANAISASNKSLNNQKAGIKTIDDWRGYLSSVSQELAKVNEDLSSTAFDPKKSAERDEMDAQRTRLENRLKAESKRDLSKLGPGRLEQEFIRGDVSERRQSAEAAAQRAIDQADAEGQAKLLRERAAKRAREAAVGSSVTGAQNAFERSTGGQQIAINERRIAGFGDVEDRIAKASARKAKEHGGNATFELGMAEQDLETRNILEEENRRIRLESGSELVRINQQILDLAKDGVAPAEAMIRRQQELVNLGKAYADNERAAAEDTASAQLLERTVEYKRMELALSEKINAVKLRGGETAALEAAKTLALLDLQIQQAEKLGNTLEAATLKGQRKELLGDRAQFRKDRGLERAQNDALINNDPKTAQALRDLAELSKLRDQYLANGLTAGQADSDFNAGITAEAKSRAPSIVADSLTAVGGGGGFASFDPMIASQQRQEKIAATSMEFLRIIADYASRGGGGMMR